MTGHVPFDASSDWTNPYCQNTSNDPLVDKMIGNAYHVVRTIYCNLGNLKLIYDFLNQYGMVLGVKSETELKALTTKASFVRLYGFDNTNKRIVTDYLYVDGDRTGIIPDDPKSTGSWILVATSNSGGGTDDGKATPPYIPYVYNKGSALGGETTIPVPAETVGVPMIVIEGYTNFVGYGFTYDPLTLTVTLAQPLEPGDEVVLMLTGTPAVPDNPNINDWIQFNWLYNGGSAVGGEQVIDIPYTFQSVPAIYKNGARYYAGLVDKSYAVDTTNQRILLTEALATNDRLIVTIGGEAESIVITDRTIQEIARSANVKDSEVILSTNTTQYLNGMKVVFDEVAQKSYGLPTLPTNVYINTVSNGKLTYSPGNITVDLIPLPNSADALRATLASSTGSSLVGHGSTTVKAALDELLSKPYISAEMFRDGIRTDQQIITDANAYAASVKKELYIPGDKTYVVDGVTATTIWRGKGKISRKTGSTGLLVNVGNGGSLFDITIDGGAGNTNTALETVKVSATTRFDIVGITLENTPGHSISLVELPFQFAPSRVNACIITGAAKGQQGAVGTGIYSYNSGNVDIEHNSVTHKGGGILQQGNRRSVSNSNVCYNSIVECYADALGMVLITEAEDQQAYEKLVVTHNRIKDCGGNGLALQADYVSASNNIVTGCGTETYHQGILVNANGCTISSNVVTANAGVGIDLGDCRKCMAIGNIVEENGWIGIEVNSCESTVVMGNVLNRNFKGKTAGPLQAAILVHKGTGGYPFLGDCRDVTIVGNSIGGGDGQNFAILVADTNCYNIVIGSNTCKSAGLLDDIVTRSPDIIAHGNYTRWDALGMARATLSDTNGQLTMPSVADVVQVNSTAGKSATNLVMSDSGVAYKGRVVRLVAVAGFVLENSAGSGGNISVGSSKTLTAGQFIKLYFDGTVWKES